MSSSRKESERAKFVQEKCQTLLTLMLRDEDNKYCVDCDAKGPRWASWNLGVFLCIRCAGIHRNLGVHISRVKSVNLDSWTPEQVVSLQQMGNSRARAVYEAQLPDGFRRPQTDATLESFIRGKYEHKKYVAREWVQPPPPKVDWDREIDEEMEKQKRKKKGLSLGTNSSIPAPAEVKKTSSTLKTTPIPAPLRKPASSSGSPKTRQISSTTSGNSTAEGANAFSSDLLGLSSPTSNPSDNDAKRNNGIDHSNDIFSTFLSGPPPATASIATEAKTITNAAGSVSTNTTATVTTDPKASLAQEEQDFFNQIPAEKGKTKMTKDSIMALYGTAPAINQFNANFGAPLVQPTNNQFVTQMMPSLNNHSNAGFGNGPIQFSTGHPTQYTMQPNNFQMPLHQQSTIGAFQSFPPHPTNTGFPMQPFAQHPNPSTSLPVTSNNLNGTNNANLNQQFGNLSLGNVWQ